MVTATKPRDLFKMEDVMPKADLLQASNSSMVYEDGFNDLREDIEGVTLDEPFVNSVEANDATEMELDYTSSESTEEHETLSDFDYD